MAGANENPGERFARLEKEIARAKRCLSALRHEGERHFIDDQPVHHEVPGVLDDIVRCSDELADLRAKASGSSAVNRAFTDEEPAPTVEEVDAQHRQLDVLEERIQRLSALLDDDPHKHERHFIDG